MFSKLTIFAAAIAAASAVEVEADRDCDTCVEVEQHVDISECIDAISDLQTQIVDTTQLLATQLTTRSNLVNQSYVVFGLDGQRKRDYEKLIEGLWTSAKALGEQIIIPQFPAYVNELDCECACFLAPYRQRLNDLFMQLSENTSRNVFLEAQYCADLETKIQQLTSDAEDEIRRLKIRDDDLAALIYASGSFQGTPIDTTTILTSTDWLNGSFTTFYDNEVLAGRIVEKDPAGFPSVDDFGDICDGTGNINTLKTNYGDADPTRRGILKVIANKVQILQDEVDVNGLEDEETH